MSNILTLELLPISSHQTFTFNYYTEGPRELKREHCSTLLTPESTVGISVYNELHHSSLGNGHSEIKIVENLIQIAIVFSSHIQQRKLVRTLNEGIFKIIFCL